uniref:Glucan endo-1,3-beta-D-glucosidase n=1 Tax=Oryza nivara TaxID=4536 RepID=A0A0E0FYP6_ORYNI
MTPIAKYLASTGAPLMANVYPYFAYVGNLRAQIDDINYALFTSPGTVVPDGSKAYQNQFDAIVDTFYSALESAGAGSVPIVVSESGWPSAGGTAASASNAQTSGRRRRPEKRKEREEFTSGNKCCNLSEVQ